MLFLKKSTDHNWFLNSLHVVLGFKLNQTYYDRAQNKTLKKLTDG
jgi:hypothetical protein